MRQDMGYRHLSSLSSSSPLVGRLFFFHPWSPFPYQQLWGLLFQRSCNQPANSISLPHRRSREGLAGSWTGKPSLTLNRWISEASLCLVVPIASCVRIPLCSLLFCSNLWSHYSGLRPLLRCSAECSRLGMLLLPGAALRTWAVPRGDFALFQECLGTWKAPGLKAASVLLKISPGVSRAEASLTQDGPWSWPYRSSICGQHQAFRSVQTEAKTPSLTPCSSSDTLGSILGLSEGQGITWKSLCSAMWWNGQLFW